MEIKRKYNTIEEYLDKLLYPSLRIAIRDLINEIKGTELYDELENEFNHCFFKNKNEILEQQKKILKLERASDYSEGDYEYWLRQNMDMNDSNLEKQEDAKIDYDPDLDDSEILNLEEEELNQEEEEQTNKFDPIKFLVERLKVVNKNKYPDDLEEALDINAREEIFK